MAEQPRLEATFSAICLKQGKYRGKRNPLVAFSSIFLVHVTFRRKGFLEPPLSSDFSLSEGGIVASMNWRCKCDDALMASQMPAATGAFATADSIAAAPAFLGLQHFPNGRNFSQWTGNDSKALMKVCYEFYYQSETAF